MASKWGRSTTGSQPVSAAAGAVVSTGLRAGLEGEKPEVILEESGKAGATAFAYGATHEATSLRGGKLAFGNLAGNHVPEIRVCSLTDRSAYLSSKHLCALESHSD